MNKTATATTRYIIQAMTFVSRVFHSNLEFSRICVRRTLEIGQLFTACHAMASIVSLVRFGTSARNVNAEQLMRYPAPSRS
jgi:hypothetical protein